MQNSYVTTISFQPLVANFQQFCDYHVLIFASQYIILEMLHSYNKLYYYNILSTIGSEFSTIL